ncbi:MAG: aminoacyl-tRNA hydrolase, partial [Pseudomonadota bacterium]
MYCIIGLGNPGKEYENNRHNIGFMAVDEIIRRYSTDTASQKYHSIYHTATIEGHKIHLLKPLTYMNKSGVAAAALCSFYKIPPENVIILHDELDIPPFTIKVKQGGGAGGHNGLKSLDAHIGKNYHRIRIGIGHPGDKDLVTPWVLGDFKKADHPHIQNICDHIAEKIPLFLT